MHSCYKQVFYIIFQSSRAGADFTRSRVSQEVLTVLNPRWNEAECTSSGVGCGRTICCRSGGWKWSAGRSTLLSDNSNYPANGTLTERRSDSLQQCLVLQRSNRYLDIFSVSVYMQYFHHIFYQSWNFFLPWWCHRSQLFIWSDFFFLFRRTCNELHGNNSKRGNFFFFLTFLFFLLIIFEHSFPRRHTSTARGDTRTVLEMDVMVCLLAVKSCRILLILADVVVVER